MQINNNLLFLQTYFFVLTLNFKQMISEIRKKHSLNVENKNIRTKILELFKNDSLTNIETQTLLSATETEKCVELTLSLYKNNLLTIEDCDTFLHHFETLNTVKLFIKNLEKSKETIFKIHPNPTPYTQNPLIPPYSVTF